MIELVESLVIAIVVFFAVTMLWVGFRLIDKLVDVYSVKED